MHVKTIVISPPHVYIMPRMYTVQENRTTVCVSAMFVELTLFNTVLLGGDLTARPEIQR